MTEQTQNRTAYRAVTLIDGTGRDPQHNMAVVVEGRKILWTGPDDQLPWGAGELEEQDCTGMYLMPGFIDTHVHLTMPDGGMGMHLLDNPPGYPYYQAIPLLRRTLDAGITTARDLGGLDMATDKAITEGLIEGPELFYAYRALGPTGGHADFRTCCGFNFGSALSPNGDIGMLTDGVDQALRNTREAMRQGAKVIKVMASGGVWSPRDTPWHDGLNIAEMRAVVQEAATHDVHVAAHAQSARSIHNALTAGVRSIEHAYEIDDPAIELMLENQAFMVPTLTTGLTPPNPHTAASYAVAKKLRLQEKIHECVGKAIAAGVKVAMGTDAGITPHGTNLRELGHLVDFGMSPMQALKAGTSNAAELLGCSDRLGTVEVGKDADLVLTAINPLIDIKLLEFPQTIEVVVAKGRCVKDLRTKVLAGVAS
ncbi:amidohydrolase family protein [Glutamicibacter sp. MNS18]|uniref:metal-dependent hydrolase family protein n=1 Tax=Glutamicibacter sp. MNS18 TaxID=2989817 RepID=UPI00223570A5|nr:amidohydrolase family protein [Glutamicibacter sp. MNS18]MCW4466754.1 amidohydrolase family protein [Glutamicibacter sp. MNS18]